MDINTLIPLPPHPLPIFLTIFLTIYLLAHFIFFRNWTPKTRPEAASCIISLTHGPPATILSTISILSNPTHNYASPNTHFQNHVLEYSIAYFTTDLIHYLTFYPTDVLFIAHHVATLFVFVTCRYVVAHGAYGVLVLLMLAEVTSLLQNVWTLAGVRKEESGFARQVFDKMSPVFYGVYLGVRGFVAPWFVYRLVGFYVSGVADDVLPKWVWVSWVCVVVVAISVSVVWVLNNWVGFCKERVVRVEKGKKVR